MGYFAYVWRSSLAVRLTIWISTVIFAATVATRFWLVSLPTFPTPAPVFQHHSSRYISGSGFTLAIDPVSKPHTSHVQYSARLLRDFGTESEHRGYILGVIRLDPTLRAQFAPLLENNALVATRRINPAASRINTLIAISDVFSAVAMVVLVLTAVLVVAIRPVLLRRRKLCRKCFHDLEGVDVLFCPECGHPTGQVGDQCCVRQCRSLAYSTRLAVTITLPEPPAPLPSPSQVPPSARCPRRCRRWR